MLNLLNNILCCDVIEGLRQIPDNSIDTCVTSPPYWGLRDYGVSGQLGLEETPEEYVQNMVEVFREVRRVLKPEGTLWLNLGDSYAGSGMGSANYPESTIGTKQETNSGSGTVKGRGGYVPNGFKPKDLCGIPWRVALSLQADGWYLRQDIIWSKPNPMPESVTDRCTKSHEYIFLLSKSQRYHYDAEAILEPVSPNTHLRISQNLADQIGSYRANGGAKTNGPMKAVSRKTKLGEVGVIKNNSSWDQSVCLPVLKRNKRSVWIVATQPYSEAHFATFPEKLIEPCILAGCPKGGIVLDPFIGSGTTGKVALKFGRNFIGIELNPKYVKIAEKRLQNIQLKIM
jgi:DNA modification methylase